MSPRQALAGLLAFGYALLLCGETLAAAPKPRARQKPPPSVTLENKRRVALQSFEIVMSGPHPLRHPPTKNRRQARQALASGDSVSVRLDKPKGCLFEARWKFEDADDAGPVDLCNDAHIVLVD